MVRIWLVVFGLLWAIAGWANALSQANGPHVGLAVVRTAQVEVAEALLVPGGSALRTRITNFSAFLVKHGTDYLLFDTGLGRNIGSQYAQDMPLWWRPFFRYGEAVDPAADQLRRAGITLKRVVLSHSHWDHASGVVDFADIPIMVSADELARLRAPSSGPGGTWASQVVGPGIQWETIVFDERKFMGYSHSKDIFGDGTVVLVPMPGHTPGSVGMFVTVDSGTRYFLIGDVAWTREALAQGADKFWVAGRLVDADPPGTKQSLVQVQHRMHADPRLRVVPAHDGKAQDALGYFPAWAP